MFHSVFCLEETETERQTERELERQTDTQTDIKRLRDCASPPLCVYNLIFHDIVIYMLKNTVGTRSEKRRVKLTSYC